MPVDVSVANQQRKMAGRKDTGDGEGSHARDIELKRSKGEISCAECRRLKIKCDKKLPCSSCLRRGCASLCPNGCLATGQGTRFVLAATDHLHRRIAKMSERIRQLEDALSIMQSRFAPEEQHPLLRDELLSLKVDKVEEVVEGETPQETSVVDAFGTLSMNEKGSSRFFGAAGGTELLLLNEEEDEVGSFRSSPAASSAVSEGMRDSRSPRLPPELALFSNAFPFTPIGPVREVQEKIESLLPPWDRACHLAETYLEQAAWLFRAVSRPQLIDEMLPILYKRRVPLDAEHEYNGPHDLSLIFMIFAVGALVDLTQEPYNAEADHYYQLAKAAITLQSVLEKPELVTIQSLHLMSIYNAMHQPDEKYCESETSMEMSWSLIRLCHQLAQTIGLHRDSARWGLQPREVQRRRALFWDLYVADSWQSLATGRPPSITLPYIDCAFPVDDEMKLNAKGESEPGFGTWSLRFACECVGQIAAKTLTAAVPAYSTILDLDAKVRDFPIPEFPKDIPMDPSKPSMVMTRYALSHTREIILLNLHRSFFAQAMTDDPINPLRSPFAPSFLASYRSAAHILKTIREEFEILPELCARFWSTWTFAFSSAVVFGSIVTRGPSSSMAPSSLAELDAACTLFSRAATHSRRAAKALVILQKLQTKAHLAYENCLGSKDAPNTSTDLPLLSSTEEKEDELAIFGGRTRLVASKRGTSSNGSSPPYMQGMNINGNDTPTPSPQPAQTTQVYSAPMSRDISNSSSLSTPPEPTDREAPMGRLDATQMPQSFNNVYQSRTDPMNGTWAQHQVAEYDQGTGMYNNARGFPAGVPEQNVRASMGGHSDGPPVKYEWGVSEPEMVPTVPTHPHYAQRQAQMHAYSHSAHPIRGMDGMEYGRPHIPPHYVPHQPAHQVPVAGYNMFSQPMQGPQHHDMPSNANAPMSGIDAAYAPAPRELAEMGLASQHSGLNQRWTSFMHDSGLFYGPDSSA